MTKTGMGEIMIRLVLTGLLLLSIWGLSPPDVFANGKIQVFDQALKQRLGQLRQDKKAHIAGMAADLSACLNQKDSRRGIFGGCGSRLAAMQAVWGVMSYGWLGQDKRYLPQLRQRLSVRNIRQEWRRVQQGKEQYTLYEKAWFLRLTLDHMRIFGSRDLVPMADWIALDMMDRLKKQGIDASLGGVDDQAWALLALYGYTAERNEVQFTWTFDAIRDNFSDNSVPCDFGRDVQAAGSQLSWCAMRMVIARRVQEPDIYGIWIDGFVPRVEEISPVQEWSTPSQYSINFVRAAAFWRAYDTDRKEKWLKAYLDHIDQGLFTDWPAMTGRGAHVAAFAILAMAPLWYLDQLEQG